MAIPKKVVERIKQQIKRYQTILADAKGRDISEADTVTILVDMLSDVFGYNKYAEVTKEFAIRGTYCDLAVKVGADTRFLIEAKAIGVPLKDNHVKQAIDYAANIGIEWVVLSSGVHWQIYKVHFQQPIDKSLVFEMDLLQANPRDPQLIECLGNLTREGFTESSMTTFYQQQQVTNRFSLAAMLLSEGVLLALRKEIKRVAPKLKVESAMLAATLRDEVLKREVFESDEAKQAVQFLKKAKRASDRGKAQGKTAASKNDEPRIQEPTPQISNTSAPNGDISHT